MTDNENKGSILIVDDTPANLEVLLEFLDTEGFEVLVAIDGESAIQRAQYVLPDIILLDVMMPKINGFETCKRLKEIEKVKEIPVIFMTALSETDNKVKGFELGAVDYITKPLQHQEVLARVNTHLTIRNLQKELQTSNERLEQRVLERTAELAQTNEQMQWEIIERKQAQEELLKLNTAYERFVPKTFLELLQRDSIMDVQLGDYVRMDMTVLFSDIRNFTHISEQMSPQDSFDFINAYLGQMGPLVQKYNGFIDKYIGDAIMALFDKSPDDAVKSAIAMLEILPGYNEARESRGRPPLHIGIGLNTGKLMLGTIGEQNRMEGTVISDAVNLASRLEGLTKLYGTPLLISEHTFNSLQDSSQYAIRFIGRVKVKGKSEAVTVYEVCDTDSPNVKEKKLETADVFKEAWQLYHQQDYERADFLFSECLQKVPEDHPAQIYIERCQYYLQAGATRNWDELSFLDSN